MDLGLCESRKGDCLSGLVDVQSRGSVRLTLVFLNPLLETLVRNQGSVGECQEGELS